MIYSTATKYGVLALIELAARDVNRPIPVRELAESAGIPRHFLAKIVQNLVKAGFLRTKRGRKGGVEFARKPSRITLAQVTRAVDGPQAFHKCIFALQPCDGSRDCPLHDRWNSLRCHIMTFVENTSISDLASSKRSSCDKAEEDEGADEGDEKADACARPAFVAA